MTERRKQAIVVGAGISGLSAANLLYEDGIDVVVLEARDRVGGRTYTKRDPFYNYLDVGGAYVGPTQDHIFRMAKNLGLETYKIHCSGDYVHYSKGHGLRFQGTWPQFRNPFAWLDVNALFRYMDKLLEEIPVEAPWDAPHAEEWDNMTMKEFYNQVCWTEEAKEFGRGFCNTNVTAEPSEISCLWFLWYVKSCGGTRRIWETENGGQERKFVGGSMQVSERLAEKLGSGRVFFESPVKSIAQGEDHVEVCTLSGTTFTADFVILAIPPSLQLAIHFEPALSSHRIQLIQRVPVGSCIKNQMYYKTAFWREKGLSGFGSAADGIEPIGNTVDDCKPDGSMPGLVGFVMADRARDFAKLTKEERKRQTCECYARLFDSEEALHPIGYEELNWMSEPYSGGCYTSTYPPGVMTRFGSELRKPYGRLFFAGTETAVSWTGYMNGAVEAGERAAREILHAMGKIPADQIFQEEPVFEEVPHKPFEMSFMERNAPSVGGCLKLAGGATVLGVLGYATYRNGVMETYESALASLKSLASFAY